VKLKYLLIAVPLLILLGAIGYRAIEGWGWLDSFYMTVITLFTVGFAEVHPLSGTGRIFTIFLIMFGIGIVTYTFWQAAQMALEGKIRTIFFRRRSFERMKKLKNHHIICGFGRMGHFVVQELERIGVPFLVIEHDDSFRKELESKKIPYVLGDATEEETLLAAGIKEAKSLSSLLPSDAENLYVTWTARSLNPELYILARALDEKAEKKLLRAGATKVIAPYRIEGFRIVNALVRPHVVEFMELVTHSKSISLSLEEIHVESGSYLVGQTLRTANLRGNFGIIVVGIKKPSGEMIFNPDPDMKIEVDDLLIALGKPEDLDRLALKTREKQK